MNPLVRAALLEVMQGAVGSDLVFSIERNGVSYNCNSRGEPANEIMSFSSSLAQAPLMGKMTRPDSRAQMIDTVRDVLVPRVGVEPPRPYGQRILSPVPTTLLNLTKRDEPIFTGLSVVKVNYVRLRLNTNQPHLSLIFYQGWCVCCRCVQHHCSGYWFR